MVDLPMIDTPAIAESPAAAPIPRKVAREQRRSRRRYKYRWIRRTTFVAVLACCLTAIPILTFRAVNAIRFSDSGRFVTSRENTLTVLPYTPVALMVHVGRDNKPLEVFMLNVYAQGIGGNTTLLPLGLELPELGSEKKMRIEDLFTAGGTEAIATRLEGLLKIRFTHVDQIDADGWATITKVLTPITVNIEDTVRSADELTTFNKGAVVLKPEQVGDFLSASLKSEPELSRLIRVKAFWEKLMAAEKTAPTPSQFEAPAPVKVTTTTSSGAIAGAVTVPSTTQAPHVIVLSKTPADDVVKFLGLIAHGDWTPINLDLKDQTNDIYKYDYYSFDIMQLRVPIARVMASAVDFGRVGGIRIRLQDGSGDPLVLAAVIRRLDAIGAVVVLATDVAPTSVQSSEIQYIGAERQAQAASVQQALHAGSVSVGANPIEGIDVTVVLNTESAKELLRG